MNLYIRHTKDTPFPMTLVADDEGLVAASANPFPQAYQTAYSSGKNYILDMAEHQLKEYFCASRRTFGIPLSLRGSPFRLTVWRRLIEIPYGETASYSEVARAVGNPAAARAVGMACNANPVMIIIPCHRVVGKNGSLTGYAGGIKLKEFLLKLESSTKSKP